MNIKYYIKRIFVREMFVFIKTKEYDTEEEADSWAKIFFRRSGWPDYPKPTCTIGEQSGEEGYIYQVPVVSWRVYRAKRRRYLIPGNAGWYDQMLNNPKKLLIF